MGTLLCRKWPQNDLTQLKFTFHDSKWPLMTKIRFFLFFPLYESRRKSTVQKGESGRSRWWTVRRKWTVQLKVDGPGLNWTVLWRKVDVSGVKWTVRLKLDDPSESGRSVWNWTVLLKVDSPSESGRGMKEHKHTYSQAYISHPNPKLEVTLTQFWSYPNPNWKWPLLFSRFEPSTFVSLDHPLSAVLDRPFLSFDNRPHNLRPSTFTCFNYPRTFQDRPLSPLFDRPHNLRPFSFMFLIPTHFWRPSTFISFWPPTFILGPFGFIFCGPSLFVVFYRSL